METTATTKLFEKSSGKLEEFSEWGDLGKFTMETGPGWESDAFAAKRTKLNELSKFGPFLQRLRVPRKIRQLVSDLERAGFSRVHGGKGSHRKFRHPKFPGFVLVSGRDGVDAQHYQEKQVKNAVRIIQG